MSDDLLEYARHVYEAKRHMREQQRQRFGNFMQDLFKAVHNDSTLRNPYKSDAEKIHAESELGKFIGKIFRREY